MSIGKLILHSSGAESPLAEIQYLIHSLRKMGLLGQPTDTAEEGFLAGERFLQLISFVGCSTNVCLTPRAGDDNKFCRLTIKGPFNPPRLLWGEGCRPPRCPACKKPLTDWKDHVDQQALKCEQCGTLTKLEDIIWGRYAGYGRIFIEINNIFPGEAQPVHDLLEGLGKLTGTKWDYFFTGT